VDELQADLMGKNNNTKAIKVDSDEDEDDNLLADLCGF
jgi:hypothetical protein